MRNEYDDELGGVERRSRKNPKMRSAGGARPEQSAQRRRSSGYGSVSYRTETENLGRSGLDQSAASSERRAASGERRHKRQSDNGKRRRRRIIAMIVAECLTLVAIFGYGVMARTMAKVQRPTDFKIENIKTNDLNVQTEEIMRGYWTIAIFGVDARDNAIQKHTNADVNMICNINLDTGEIRLVSVYRDSYLNISEEGSYNKLNMAYAMGGAEQAVGALNRNLDLKINDFVTFNWKGVAQAINILGGVDVELSKAEFYYINSFITETVKATGIASVHLKSAGMNHLDGVQAVAYGRLRLMDTDYARTERQRKIIQLAFDKAKKADFQTLYTMIGTVFPNVYTSLWVDDLVNNAKNIDKFYLGETSGFPLQRGEANMGKKGAVVVPATLESNVIRLHEFLFGDEAYTPSDTVKKISGKISADTGIYKEGQVIDRVGTGGGVIQQPKTTAAASETRAEKNTEEEGYQYVYETNEDGEKVKKKVKMETDEDGEYIKYETDEDGFLLEHIRRPEETLPVQTDEEGNVLNHPLRPSQTNQTDEDGRPLESSSENEERNEPGGRPEYPSQRPGQTTNPTQGTGSHGTTNPTPGTGSHGTTNPTQGTGGNSSPGSTPGTAIGPSSPTQSSGSYGPSSSTPGTGTHTAPGGGTAVSRPGAAETTEAETKASVTDRPGGAASAPQAGPGALPSAQIQQFPGGSTPGGNQPSPDSASGSISAGPGM